MTKAEMNRRLAELNEQKINHILRLIKNGYNAQDVKGFLRIDLRLINAVFAKVAGA